jgi:hypothetical protein
MPTSDATMVESNEGWLNRKAVRLRSDPSFWAFPSALQKLKGGMRSNEDHDGKACFYNQLFQSHG